MGRFIGRKILGVLLLAGMIAAGLTGCKKADGPKDEYDCFISMDDAKVEAEKKNLPILVTVTVEESERDGMEAGSKYYLENILGTKEFKDYADNHFVLYRFDFSQKSYEKTVAPENASDKEKAEADKYAQYMKEGYMLASILGVQYTPSIFILTKEGYPVSEVEYFEDSLSADGFIKILETYADKTQFLNDMLSATKKGSNEEKLKAIEALYSTTPDMWQIFLLDLAKQAGAVPGLIASGDRFCTRDEEIAQIKERFPDALAVDMESCSVAQVCHLDDVPFLSLRVISDCVGSHDRILQYKDFWGSVTEKSVETVERFLEIL